MPVLKYPGICEHCEASLLCASGGWSSIRHTRCKYCGTPVLVFHASNDIRKETVMIISGDCPVPFSGVYTICGSEQCSRACHQEYRALQQAQQHKVHVTRNTKNITSRFMGPGKPKKRGTK